MYHSMDFIFSCKAGNLQINWKMFKPAFLLGSYAVSNVAMNNHIFDIKLDQSKLFSHWILSYFRFDYSVCYQNLQWKSHA